MVHLASLNPERRFRSVPLWLPFMVVALLAAALWGIMTVLGSSALGAVPDNLRPAVATLAAAGNIMTALTALAFWPLIALALFGSGMLLGGSGRPDFRDLLCGIGLAHLPAALGTLIVWIMVVAGRTAALPDGLSPDSSRIVIASGIAAAVSRVVALSGYFATAAAFIVVVHGLFRTSWLRAAAIVAVPLSLYYFSIAAVRGALD